MAVDEALLNLMTTQKTLADIQVGDELIQDGSGYGRQKRVVTVTKLTKTKIVTTDGRFNRETGYAPSSGRCYFPQRVYMPADGEIQRVRNATEASRIASKLRHDVAWETTPLEALRDINAILKQHNQ
jgi:hypothetical protein